MKNFIIILLICTFSSFSYSDSAIDLIIVDKSERELKLMKNGITIKEYRIDLGFDPVGHKYFKGDGKTPEGLYFISKKSTTSYFYMALKISSHGYIMETGNIVMDNPSSKLLQDQDVQEFYLGLNAEGTDRKSFKDVKHYKRKKRWLS